MNAPFDTPDAPFGHHHGPMLTGAWAPIHHELCLRDLRIDGDIPLDLNGVYLRNGPNPRFRPKGAYHPFDGDGMIHAVEFRHGTVTYRNKWVRTEGWRANDAAGEETHWGVMSTLKGRVDQPMNDTSNTDIIGHGGRALSTWYLAGKAYHIDPITLETIGSDNFDTLNTSGESVGQGISAHPKVDPVTGELMFFDYFDHAPFMAYGVMSKDGQLIHHVPIPLPGDRLPHDMGVTENYSILHDLPVYHCPEAMKAGRHKIVFNADLPARFGVIPRFGQSHEIRWFEFSPCFIYHVINCWEDGDTLTMIACRYMPVQHPDGSIDTVATAKRIARLGMDARLWRYDMNLVTGQTQEHCLNAEFNVEFPGYDLRRTGRPSRWAYLVDHHPVEFRWTGLRKFDIRSGACVGSWSDGDHRCWYSEPWFAPRDGSHAEDDGYVVTLVWHDDTHTQEIQLFDARHISDGPLTRITLPYRVPSGFHACWMRPDQIASWDTSSL